MVTTSNNSTKRLGYWTASITALDSTPHLSSICRSFDLKNNVGFELINSTLLGCETCWRAVWHLTTLRVVANHATCKRYKKISKLSPIKYNKGHCIVFSNFYVVIFTIVETLMLFHEIVRFIFLQMIAQALKNSSTNLHYWIHSNKDHSKICFQKWVFLIVILFMNYLMGMLPSY